MKIADDACACERHMGIYIERGREKGERWLGERSVKKAVSGKWDLLDT